MAVINSEIDRRTKKEAFWAEGVVEYVKLDKFDELKVSYIKQAGQPDKKIESTHKASILLKEKGAGKDDAGVWVGLGEVKLHPEHENLQVKHEDKWVTIEKGVELSMDVKVNEWNGKTYYQSSKGKINILSMEGVAAAQQETSKGKQSSTGSASDSKQSSYKPRDNTGMQTGHAVNGALELKRGGAKGDAFDLAGMVHVATDALKAVVAQEKGVDVNNYDLGASVGHAILNACRDLKSANPTVEQITEKAHEVLELSERVAATIRNGGVVPEVKEEKKVEKTKPVKPSEPPMDFDDDVPF